MTTGSRMDSVAWNYLQVHRRWTNLLPNLSNNFHDNVPTLGANQDWRAPDDGQMADKTPEQEKRVQRGSFISKTHTKWPYPEYLPIGIGYLMSCL
jgi:hypothetical protein